MEDRSSRRMRTLVTQMAGRGLSGNENARALTSMMARSTKPLQAEAGYIDARPQRRQIDEILLQRTAGPYIGVTTGLDGSALYVCFRRVRTSRRVAVGLQRASSGH